MNRRRVDWFSPVVLFPAVYIGYVALGMIPISNLWYPPPTVLAYFALGLLGYLLGALLVWRLSDTRDSIWTVPDSTPAAPRLPATPLHWAAWGLAAVGLLAAMMVLSRGIPLLHAGARGSSGSMFYMAAHALWFGVALSVHLSGEAAFRRGQRWVGWMALFSLGILFLLAYRTPLIYLSFLLLLWWHYHRRPVTWVHVSLFGAVVVLGATLFSYLRQVLTYGAERWAYYVSTIGVGEQWAWLVPFHLVTREGVAIFQKLVYVSPPTGGYGGMFHLSSFLVALPGAQDSPRRIVSDILGHRAEVTTTPSIIGPWYMDFGVLGILVGMFLLGAMLAGLYRQMKRAAGLERGVLTFLYAYASCMALAGIHTGILDLEIYGLLLVGYVLWRWAQWTQKKTASLPH